MFVFKCIDCCSAPCNICFERRFINKIYLLTNLLTLLTHDCSPSHPSNYIIKFADDTTIVGLISKGDESAYKEEVEGLVAWDERNNLTLNVKKTREMIIDFRRSRPDHYTPLTINGEVVERVAEFKFLGVIISDSVTDKGCIV